MPGHKNKSYKLGFYVPKTFKDNYPALDSSYPNFVYRDSDKSNDFRLDQARRKLPPIPTEMDNGRVSMIIGDNKKPVSPLTENTYAISNSISSNPAETHTRGYQMTHNPIYNSSTTTLDSESSSLTPIRHVSSSTDADESSLDQISQNIEKMSLEFTPNLTDTTTENPLFIEDINNSIKSQDMPNKLTVVATVESDYLSQKTHLQSCLEESNDLFIPEPDYDEDEFTIDFKSEDGDKPASDRNSGNLYKDYEGEDFGQYLSDEEEHVENVGFTWRKNIRHNYPRQDHSRKARTEVKRQRISSQRTAEKLFKSAPKMKGSTMRQNLRDFSFADAKISLGNSISQSYNNRYKKNTEVTAEDEQFLRSGNSYEQYLQTRFSQNMDGETQNWSQKESENQKFYERALGLDFTGKLTRRLKMSKDAIVGRLTTKFRRKSESSFQIPED